MILHQTYREGLVGTEDGREHTVGLFDNRILLRVKNSCLTHQTSATEREILLVSLRQLALCLQTIIHTLTDGTVSTVGSDNDITNVHAVIVGVDSNLIILLGDIKDPLAKMDLVSWDLLEDQRVELWTRNEILCVASAVKVKKKV